MANAMAATPLSRMLHRFGRFCVWTLLYLYECQGQLGCRDTVIKLKSTCGKFLQAPTTAAYQQLCCIGWFAQRVQLDGAPQNKQHSIFTEDPSAASE